MRACARAGVRGLGWGAGPRAWGGKCGLVLKARWGGQGSLTLSPPGSIGPGPRNLHVGGTYYLPIPRLQMHGDGRALGTTRGDPRFLTAKWHMWRRRTSWVPHSHGLGRCRQAEGSQGAQSASLPWDLLGMIPGCGAAAPLVLGASRAHYRTGPSSWVGGGGGVLGHVLGGLWGGWRWHGGAHHGLLHGFQGYLVWG